MDSVSPPLYMYPDQLISDTWVTWSEKLLSQQHDVKYTTQIGFQRNITDILGKTTGNESNERTRALELFNSGMLRGVLVNAQGTTGVPYGWNLIQGDQNVHSRLGYSAYAIGKALAAGDNSFRVESAFSAICAVIILQSGFINNGRYISTIGLFNWVMRSFHCPLGVDNNTWNRYVASAMFCTLNDSGYGESLANDYLNQQSIVNLRIGGPKGNMQTVDPVGLLTLINNKYSLTNIQHQKASLYWIGNYNETTPRGLYTRAMLHSSSLLMATTALEWSLLAVGQPSPLSIFTTKNKVGEEPCVLDKLAGALKSDPTTKIEWSKTMKTLFEGTWDSIKYLSDSTNLGNPSQFKIFYAHGAQGDPTGIAQWVMRVKKDSCIRKPIQNDFVVFAGNRFRLVSIDSDGDDWKILCKLG